MIKPDGVQRCRVGEIIGRFEKKDFSLKGENTEVNITDRDNLDKIRYGPVEAACSETTESSSSFEESISGVDEGDLCGNDATSALSFGEFSDSSDMRKVTPHWRDFIKPVMWRCKWLELQLVKFKLLEKKCEKELADYSDRKKIEFMNFGLEYRNSRSTPFHFAPQRNKILERKRRRRYEDEQDIAEYMSKHRLFSFYENRNRNSAADDGAFWNDDQFNPGVIPPEKLKGINEMKVEEKPLNFNHIERNNSMEQILRKIEGLQSKVSRFKARLEMIPSENDKKFDQADNDHCFHITDLPLPIENGDRVVERRPPPSPPSIAAQLLAEFSLGDFLTPCSDLRGNGESLTQLTDQSLVVGPHVNNEDVFLIYDQSLKERLRSFHEFEMKFEENRGGGLR